MTKSIVLLLILVVVIVGIFFFLFFQQPQDSNNGQDVSVETLKDAQANAASNVLRDSDGNPFIIFDAQGAIDTYVLVGGAYDIDMDADGAFLIVLKPTSQAEFEELRSEAEQKLLQLIGHGPNVACELDVSVRVLARNSPFEGQELPLSFCQ